MQTPLRCTPYIVCTLLSFLKVEIPTSRANPPQPRLWILIPWENPQHDRNPKKASMLDSLAVSYIAMILQQPPVPKTSFEEQNISRRGRQGWWYHRCVVRPTDSSGHEQTEGGGWDIPALRLEDSGSLSPCKLSSNFDQEILHIHSNVKAIVRQIHRFTSRQSEDWRGGSGSVFPCKLPVDLWKCLYISIGKIKRENIYLMLRLIGQAGLWNRLPFFLLLVECTFSFLMTSQTLLQT